MSHGEYETLVVIFFCTVLSLAAAVLVDCTAAQLRTKEVRIEQDCQKLEDNPVTPNIEKYVCETADLAIVLVSVPRADGGL